MLTAPHPSADPVSAQGLKGNPVTNPRTEARRPGAASRKSLAAGNSGGARATPVPQPPATAGLARCACLRRLWPGRLPSTRRMAASPGRQSCVSSGPRWSGASRSPAPKRTHAGDFRPGAARPALSDSGRPVPDARKPVPRQLSLFQSGSGRRGPIDRSLQPSVPAGEESIRRTLPLRPR